MSNDKPSIDADAICTNYLTKVTELMQRILAEEVEAMDRAAERIADQVAADRLIHVFGPGGHSNLAAQEIFFRAGGLMHISAIMDEGTLLSNGALRSMAMERTPGYGRIVIQDRDLQHNDLLILVNAYGINAALIDAALEAQHRGVYLIGISSREHANKTAPDHPARHPSRKNLHDVVDISVDCKVAIGDAVVSIPGMDENIAAVSTFANAYTLNCIVIRTVAKLLERGIEPPVWRSGNAPGGDEANARFIGQFRHRVQAL
jgi:uncharacterized phosphosugar-binding protein